MIRLLITGDRNWYTEVLAREVLGKFVERHGHEVTVVHGDCGGIDHSFSAIAKEMGLGVEAHPANWAKFDAAAGPIRNQEMVDLGAKFCFAFHRYLKGSKGTKDCVSRCLEAGIPVYLFENDSASYFRVDRSYFEKKLAGRK